MKHFEFWDAQHVVNKFPHAPEFLQKRLGRANTKRRQLLIYQERHHQKISQLPDAVSEAPWPTLHMPMAMDVSPDHHVTPSKELSTAGAGTTLSETTATTFYAAPVSDSNHKALPYDQVSDTGESQTSYATSYASTHIGGSGSGTHMIPVPIPLMAEEQGFDSEPFECLYCRHVVSIKDLQS